MTLSRIKLFELELEREAALERAEAILRESPPILREKVEWIRTSFDEEWRRSIVSRYQIAIIIRDIYDDVTDHKGSVYGAHAVEAIQAMFAWDNGVIYHALNFADAYTPAQIE